MSRKLFSAFVGGAVVILALAGPAFTREPAVHSPRGRDLWPQVRHGTDHGRLHAEERRQRRGRHLRRQRRLHFLARDHKPLRRQAVSRRGYTVFAVVHGSQPRYQIPEIIQDMNRAVRFIRYHAKDYGIDPNRIGVTGGSAGGHLSLMLGWPATRATRMPRTRWTASRAEFRPWPASSRPPTSSTGALPATSSFMLPTTSLDFGPPLTIVELDPKTNLWERITDEAKLRQMAHDISPIYYVNPDDPPTFIMHGDKDPLVPLQQSESFIAKLKEAGVECEAGGQERRRTPVAHLGRRPAPICGVVRHAPEQDDGFDRKAALGSVIRQQALESRL